MEPRRLEDRGKLLKTFKEPSSDDWKPHQDQRARSQVQHTGQQKEERVLRLRTVNSVQENILAAAKHELSVDQPVTQAAMLDRRSSSHEHAPSCRPSWSRKRRKRSADHETVNQLVARHEEEFDRFCLGFLLDIHIVFNSRLIRIQLVVWVDPLDGTKEYTEGLLDNVTVLIGIAYEGKAIAGIINQPYYNYENNEKQQLREHRNEAKAGPDAVLGRTIWGVLGLGAFGFQLKEVPTGKHIITTTRSHSNKLVTDCVTAMNPDVVLRVGGAGNKIIQLIEGKASAYVFASPGCKKWDTCAPEVILHAVGGKLTDIHGNVLQYHKDVKHLNSAGVLATLRNYDYYASRVPDSVKNALVP
ncbi:3'(2'),5'-bisphosphate nucleotidase 1-like [Callithrix jacchus]